MNGGFVWLASFLIYPLVGGPLLAHPAYRDLGLAARVTLSAAVGIVFVTTAMTVSSLVGLHWIPLVLVAAGAGLSILARLAIPGRAVVPSGFRSQALEASEWVAGGIAVTSVLLAALATLATTATSLDLFLFWGPKSMAFASARGIDAGYLSEPLLKYQHFSYPPLLPNAFGLATILASRLSWLGAMMTFPLALGCLALALPGILRRVCSRKAALVTTAVLCTSITLIGQVYLVAGNADMFLWAFQILAISLLVGVDGPEDSRLLLGGLLLGGAAAVKVEGLPFSVATAMLSLLALKRHLRLPASWLSVVARLLGPTVAVVAIWFGYEKRWLGTTGYESYGPFFQIQWQFLPAVLKQTFLALLAAGGGLPWLVPVAGLLLARPRLRDLLVTGGIAVLLAAFFLFTYLHGPDPTSWIVWSAGRLFASIGFLLTLAWTIAVGNRSSMEEPSGH